MNDHSLRDAFAAAALCGLGKTLEAGLLNATTNEECGLAILNAAVLSYRLADEMLKQKNLPSGSES